jgi:hypothetical protein
VFKSKTTQINRHSVDKTGDPTESNIGPSSRIVLKAYATISHVIEKRKSTCKTSRSYQKASALCNVFVIENTVHNRNKASVRIAKIQIRGTKESGSSGTFNIHRSTIPPYIGHHKGDLEHQDPNIALLQVELHQDRLVAHSIHTQKKSFQKHSNTLATAICTKSRRALS